MVLIIIAQVAILNAHAIRRCMIGNRFLSWYSVSETGLPFIAWLEIQASVSSYLRRKVLHNNESEKKEDLPESKVTMKKLILSKKSKTGKKRTIRIIAVKKRGTLELACGDMDIIYKREPLCCVRIESDTGVVIERSREYDRIKVSLAQDKAKKGREKSSRKNRSKIKILVSMPKKWSIKSSDRRGTISKAT